MEHSPATEMMEFTQSILLFNYPALQCRLEQGYAQVLDVVGDLICCISNFADFWGITSLSLPYGYKEVTVLKLEPLQLQLTEKVMQTLLNFSHHYQHFYHFQTFSCQLRALKSFLDWFESRMKKTSRKEPHPSSPKNHQICFAFITSILLPLHKVRPISAIKV